MGYQSSRIVWGKTQKNPDDHGYNIVPISDYDPENIYTSGNIVIHKTGYRDVESDYRAFQCVAAEAAGEFNENDESTWKLLKGILPVGKVVFIPDSDVEQIVNSPRTTYKPGAKVIKLNKNGNHYMYKCIEKTSIYLEGWVKEKWQLQEQRVGVAWIPRDHKDVYYNGKFHRAMWFMPEDYDSRYDMEIGPYNEETQYFFGEQCICEDSRDNKHKLYKFVSHTPQRGSYPPQSVAWEEITDVKEYEEKPYAAGDKIIYQKYNVIEAPVEDFKPEREYEPDQYCLHLINDPENGIAQKDLNTLVECHEYVKKGDSYLADTQYAKDIENGLPIYALYINDTGEIVRDSGFMHNHWSLVTARDTSTPTGILIECKNWDLGVSRSGKYESGYPVLFSKKDSNEIVLYRCKEDHRADSPTYLPTEVPESYNSGTLDAKQPTDDKYWRVITQRHIDRAWHVYKAVRRTGFEEFNSKDWVIITQNKHDDLGDYGIIWRKLGGMTSGGDPFYFPLIVPGVLQQTGNTYFKRSRLNSFVPFLGDNNLQPLTVFMSRSTSSSTHLTEGDYVRYMYSTANGIYAFGESLDTFGNILVWQNQKHFKIYKVTELIDNADFSTIDLFKMRASFYQKSSMLVALDEDDEINIYRITFLDETYSINKVTTLDEGSNLYLYRSFLDGHIASVKEYTGRILPAGVSSLQYVDTDYYFTNISGLTCLGDTIKANTDYITGDSHWPLDDWFGADCRILERQYYDDYYDRWFTLNVYDIKDDFILTSYTGSHQAIAIQKLSDLGAKETILPIKSPSGDTIYILKKLFFCYSLHNGTDVTTFTKTSIKTVNNGTIHEKVLTLAGNRADQRIVITDCPYVDESTVSMTSDEIDTDPIGNLLDIGELMWVDKAYMYFKNDRVFRYYDVNDGSLDSIYTSATTGIWELNAFEAEANLVVDLHNRRDMLAYKQILMWNCILRIPYYGNQTCYVSGYGDLDYLYIGNIRALYNAYPEDFTDLETFDEIGFQVERIYEKKMLITKVGEPTAVKCNNDSGGPVQGDKDLVFSTNIELHYNNTELNKKPCTLVVVLPNYYSIDRFKNASLGYDAITNGAFFWLTQDTQYPGITPQYGGPENDAQGFSGW